MIAIFSYVNRRKFNTFETKRFSFSNIFKYKEYATSSTCYVCKYVNIELVSQKLNIARAS